MTDQLELYYHKQEHHKVLMVVFGESTDQEIRIHGQVIFERSTLIPDHLCQYQYSGGKIFYEATRSMHL
jgi:hypothetical protein